MKKKIRLPFQNLTREAWVNLALVATLTFYAIQIGSALISGEICKDIASDYCAYWSAGRIINLSGFPEIYNLELLSSFQRNIYPQGNEANFVTFGVFYLPVFVLPFKFLSKINLATSYLFWISANLVGLIFYLKFFVKETVGYTLPNRVLLLFLISLPVFLNVYEGQVNVLLCISIGEFMRAYLSDKPMKSGSWLGGLMIKPQLLVLILPFLILRRSIKIIKGFALSAFILLLISFALIGRNGLRNFINTIMVASEGGLASNTAMMTNWRMVGWHTAVFSSETLGLVITIIGSFLTIAISFLFFFSREKIANHKRFMIELLCLLAVTCAVAWHAHLHMMMILIPPILYLFIKDQFNKKLLLAWIFAPVFIFFISYLIAAGVKFQLGVIPRNVYQLTNFMGGMSGFVLNLIIFGWLVKKTNTPENGSEDIKNTFDEYLTK